MSLGGALRDLTACGITTAALLRSTTLTPFGPAPVSVFLQRQSSMTYVDVMSMKRLGSILNRQCDGDECELTAVTRQDTHSAQ